MGSYCSYEQCSPILAPLFSNYLQPHATSQFCPITPTCHKSVSPKSFSPIATQNLSRLSPTVFPCNFTHIGPTISPSGASRSAVGFRVAACDPWDPKRVSRGGLLAACDPWDPKRGLKRWCSVFEGGAIDLQILIIDYKLVFPSGMATAVLINGFHSRGDKMAKKQVRGFVKYFSMSFIWGFFQWFYTGDGSCGFLQFPTFGLEAWRQTFYFDFSMIYVGTGMICSHLVSLSLLFGAVLSWGLMWPLISKQKGFWFPQDSSEESMQGLNGYKVFVSIALIFGDGFYNFFKVLLIILINVHGRLKQKSATKNSEANGNAKAPPSTLKGRYEGTPGESLLMAKGVSFSMISWRDQM